MPPPAPRDPIRDLFAAALRAAAHLGFSERPVRVTLYCREKRKILDLEIPLTVCADEAPAREEDAGGGWLFVGRAAIFNGRRIVVSTSRVKLLQVLAEATEPLTAKDLTARAFDAETDVANTRFHIRELRGELKKAFGFEEEAIVGENDGYRLVYPR